jgi:hypothetical protein
MEQARLRNEYIKMEEKLRAMETRIKSGAPSPVANSNPASPTAAPFAVAAGDVAGRSLTPAAAGGGGGGEGAAAFRPGEDDAEGVAGAAVANGAGAGAAMAAYDLGDDAGQQSVVVVGGEGEVDVQLDKEGVLVFRFAEVERPRGPVSVSVRSSQQPTESGEEY